MWLCWIDATGLTDPSLTTDKVAMLEKTVQKAAPKVSTAFLESDCLLACSSLQKPLAASPLTVRCVSEDSAAFYDALVCTLQSAAAFVPKPIRRL